MKRVNVKILILILCALILPGCSGANFFDVREVMRPPKLSESQADIKTAVHDYFGADIIWCYPSFDGKYAAIIEENLPKSGANWAVAFCQTEELSQKMHILFLHQKDQNWLMCDDVVHSASDIDRILIRDAEDEDAREIIILNEGFEGADKSILIYRYNGTDVKEIDVTDDFVDFIRNDNK